MESPEDLPADATCLIYLAKIDSFESVALCVPRLLVAPGVWREAVLDGERLGYADPARIRQADTVGFLVRSDLDVATARQASVIAESWRLGQGESETLALGLERGKAIVDDGRAARVAQAIGVEPVSTLFLPALGALRGTKRDVALELLHALAVVASARAESVLVIEEFVRRHA